MSDPNYTEHCPTSLWGVAASRSSILSSSTQTCNVFQRVLVLRKLKCYIPLLLGAELKCTFVVGSLARSLELGPQVEVCPQVVEQTLGDCLILD